MYHVALLAARGLDFDTHKLINRAPAAGAVQPDGVQAKRYSNTEYKLKSQWLRQKLEVYYVPSAHDAAFAALNFLGNSSYDCTRVNSPTFTAFRGYAGNGTSSYLNSGWNPATNGVTSSQNSLSFGWYLNAGNNTQNSVAPLGCEDATPSIISLRPRSVSDANTVWVNNSNTGPYSPIGGATRYGLSAANRSASNAVQAYRDGVAVGAGGSTISNGVPSFTFFWGAINNAGSATSFVDNRMAWGFVASSMTAGEHAAISRMVFGDLQSVGAQT